MLKVIEEYPRLRKLRLAGCACLRHAWLKVGPDANLRAIEAVEQYVDGIASMKALTLAVRNAADMDSCFRCVAPTPLAIGQLMERMLEFVQYRTAERGYHCAVLRAVFGYLFRKLPPRPEAIAPLAERIYVGQWELMPLLGEWLQEHGYWSEGDHCLDPKNQHVKGCWVVDWVTGRE